MIKAVIFDLDGTLLNTLVDLKNSLNHVLRKYGMAERTLEETRRFVGNGLRRLLVLATSEGTDEALIEEMYDEFQRFYDIHCMDETGPYDGIMEMLEGLHKEGYRLAIVSNKIDSAVKELCNAFFADCIKVAIGENEKEGIKRKPAPDTAIEAMRQLGVSKEEAVYVGDSDVDIATAAAAGLPCISVTWGFKDRDFLVTHGAAVFANTPQDVINIINLPKGTDPLPKGTDPFAKGTDPFAKGTDPFAKGTDPFAK